ncbi:MAG TPA: hypothetical protein ENJ20_02045, partial [Bacteroidetes bacterium]|nr:hypothetical protein [Bacteroidota bacterium]
MLIFLKKNKKGKRLSVVVVILLVCGMWHSRAVAQKPLVPAPVADTLPVVDTVAAQYIHIRYADELTYLATGADTLQKLVGHVELNQDTVFLFCDSATILNSREMVARGHFILQQGDSTTIFADSAEYSGRTQTADLFSRVVMVKGRQKLFTDRLSYNADTKIATYLSGATLTDDTTYLQSTRGYFHAKTDDIFFKDSVVVVSPDFTLRSDTLKFNARTKVVTFLAPVLITQDSARIYTESGIYDINRKYAEFRKNPQYVKNDQKARAIRMIYDGNKKEVTLLGNALFEDSVSVARADIIRRNEKTGLTTLEGNAFYRDKRRTLTGDTIVYNSKDESYSTRGRSRIEDGGQILEADRVDYDKAREMGIATGNVIFTDTLEKTTVICEYAEHSQKNDYLKAFGGRDSIGQPARPLLIKVIDGDSLFISADTLLSFVPPDSLTASTDTLPPTPATDSSLADSSSIGLLPMPSTRPLSADTSSLKNIPAGTPQQRPTDTLPPGILQKMEELPQEPVVPTGSLPPPDSIPSPAGKVETPLLDLIGGFNPEEPANDERPISQKKEKKERIILAYNDVRILKSDLQARCDSLSYSSADSLFRLFHQPVIWSDTSQFTADHIRIQLANGAIDRIYMENNSFITNTPDEVFFNQIKGRNSTAQFDSSELRIVRVAGNAESVYYALDDERAYIGVNKTVCSEMKIIFGNNEVTGIV